MTRPGACLLLLLLQWPAGGAEIEVRYSALERILATQVFTQDGRRYVRGSPADKCRYAYLESPHLGAENGRFKIAARFSGRSALDVFGRCVGLGDSFDFVLTSDPVPKNSVIALSNVKVATIRDSYYIRRVRAALTLSVAKSVEINAGELARRLVDQSTGPPKAELTAFDISHVRVTPDSLVLVLDFKLVVK